MTSTAFGVYCVVKQYLWQRSNRRMQQMDPGLLSSPTETTPIIRRNTNRNSDSHLQIDHEENPVPLSTFSGPSYNLRSRSQISNPTSAGATTTTFIDFKPLTMVKNLEPFLETFKPNNPEELDGALLIQRLQIMVACHHLRLENARKALHELGRVFALTSEDPNSESCK